jgi:RimJ/RimL family protein N-acetyltransferase
MGPVPTLVGTRCVLRELSPGDAASLARHADDEAVWRNLFEGFPRPYTLADAETWCDPQRRLPAAGFVWGIEVEGAIAGCISVVPEFGVERCNAEVGYWLGQAFWGRGIVGEALASVTAWVWASQPEITRLYAPIFAWNQASQRVAAKAGYELEAVLPQSAFKAGRLIDRVRYASYRRPVRTEEL